MKGLYILLLSAFFTSRLGVRLCSSYRFSIDDCFWKLMSLWSIVYLMFSSLFLGVSLLFESERYWLWRPLSIPKLALKVLSSAILVFTGPPKMILLTLYPLICMLFLANICSNYCCIFLLGVCMEWTALLLDDDLMGKLMEIWWRGGSSRLSFLRRLLCSILFLFTLFWILFIILTFSSNSFCTLFIDNFMISSRKEISVLSSESQEKEGYFGIAKR